MQSILIDFPNMKAGQYLYILPIKRLSLTEKFKHKNIAIYPSGSIDVDELFKCHTFLNDSLSKIGEFKKNTLIAFIGNSTVQFPGQTTNNFHLLNYAIDYLTPFLDYIDFLYCNINNNKSLIGRVGQIETGESLLLLFNGLGSPFTRIIFEKINVNTITLGNGLIFNDINNLSSFPLLNDDLSEVGNIAIHALRMYVQMLESNSNTEKFIHMIRLFEFIASPDEYEKFQNVKTKIISHVAKNVHQIHEISEDFKYYSSGDNGDGLRTQIFHKGAKIEELINDKEDLKELFKKLHRYLFICITDLLNNYNKDWDYIEQYRIESRQIAENNKTKDSVDKYSSTIILIDGDFLSCAITLHQKMYSDIYPQKELNSISLANLCYEILLNNRKWGKDQIYGFLIFHSKSSKFPLVKEPFDEMNGKVLIVEKTEFEFHTFYYATEEELFQAINTTIDKVSQTFQVITDKLSIYENIILCGDNEYYEKTLKNILDKDSKDIVLIRDSNDSKLENLGINYFDIGHLVGKISGLKSNEL